MTLWKARGQDWGSPGRHSHQRRWWMKVCIHSLINIHSRGSLRLFSPAGVSAPEGDKKGEEVTTEFSTLSPCDYWRQQCDLSPELQDSTWGFFSPEREFRFLGNWKVALESRWAKALRPVFIEKDQNQVSDREQQQGAGFGVEKKWKVRHTCCLSQVGAQSLNGLLCFPQLKLQHWTGSDNTDRHAHGREGGRGFKPPTQGTHTFKERKKKEGGEKKETVSMKN